MPSASALEEQDVVTANLANRFLVTLGRPMRRFAPGDPAPAGLHWCLAPEVSEGPDLGPDGIARGGILPELELPRRMWAGVALDILAPLRIGDAVTRRSRVIDIHRKHGRSGPLAFAEIGHEFLVEGEVRISERQTIVYRAEANDGAAATESLARNPPPHAEVAGAAGPRSTGDRGASFEAPLRGAPQDEEVGDLRPDAEPEPRPDQAVVIRRLTIDETQLFRFSALTFNAHRIHLDRDYATSEEGHAGLIVHGPLTAALVLDAVEAKFGSGSVSIALRAVAPALCGQSIVIGARRPESGGLQVEAQASGRRVMTGSFDRDTARASNPLTSTKVGAQSGAGCRLSPA